MNIVVHKFASAEFSKWSNPNLAIKLNELFEPDQVTTKFVVPSPFRKYVKEQLNIDLPDKTDLKSLYNMLKSADVTVFDNYDPASILIKDVDPKYKELGQRIYAVYSILGSHGPESKEDAKSYEISKYHEGDRYFNFYHRGYSYRSVYSIGIKPDNGKVIITKYTTRVNGRKVSDLKKYECSNANEVAIALSKIHSYDLIKSAFEDKEIKFKTLYVPKYAADPEFFLNSYEGRPRIIAVNLEHKARTIDGFRSYKAAEDYVKEYFPDDKYAFMPLSGMVINSITANPRYIAYDKVGNVDDYINYVGNKYRDLLNQPDYQENTKALVAASTRYKLTESEVVKVSDWIKAILDQNPSYIAVSYNYDKISDRSAHGLGSLFYSFDEWVYRYNNYKKDLKGVDEVAKNFEPSLLSVSKSGNNYILKLVDGPVPDYYGTTFYALKSKPKIDTNAKLDVEAFNKIPETLGKGKGYYVFTSKDGNDFTPILGPVGLDDLKNFKSDDPYQLAVFGDTKAPKVYNTKKYALHSNSHNLVGFYRYAKYLGFNYDEYLSFKQVPTKGQSIADTRGIGRIGKTFHDNPHAKCIIIYDNKELKVITPSKENNLIILSEDDMKLLLNDPAFIICNADPELGNRSYRINNIRMVGLRMFKKTGLYDDGASLEDDSARGATFDSPKYEIWRIYNRLTKCVYRYYNDGDHPWRQNDSFNDVCKEGIEMLNKFCKSKGIKYSFGTSNEKDFFGALDLTVQLIFRGI